MPISRKLEELPKIATREGYGQTLVDLGKEYENIKSCPHLEKGNFVGVCDTIKATDSEDWYYIKISCRSHGFVHSKYIKEFISRTDRV